VISEEIIRRRFNSKVTVRISIEDKGREDLRVYLMGVHLTGVHLMGVYLIGVHLMACTSQACTSPVCISYSHQTRQLRLELIQLLHLHHLPWSL
jgi:hypothetical protein